ncbi:glycosyl hydrolase-related protein [Mangrovibacter sp. SLW1]
MTNGLREFEVIASQADSPRDTLALTLLRGVGVLGKENLLLRPGRPSGIKIPTPDSQTRGKLVCQFTLMPFAGTIIEAGVMAQARENNTPIQCYNKIPYNAMKLNVAERNIPATYSLLQKSPEGTVLSVLKKAEDADALILRVYNPSEQDVLQDDIVTFNHPISGWQETGLDEIPRATSGAQSHTGALKPCQVKSYQITL